VSIRIHADRIDQIDHSPEVALYNVRVDYQSPQGQAWVLLGDTGHVEPGGKIIDVAGNVRLEEQSRSTPAPPCCTPTRCATAFPTRSRPRKATCASISARAHLTARGLWANLKERTMRLESKVNGRFQP
jgi:LPS export ABC transporter protein LptC